MTIINPKNIAGVTSITTPSGSDNLFTVHTNDTTERFRIDSTGTASFGGDVSIGGTVSVGGTLTYEDVTNVDAVGLITARNGIEIGARPGVAASISVDGNMIVSGISTFGDNIRIVDNKKLLFGNLAAGDCQIIHDGTDTFIQNKTGDLKIANNVAGDVGGDIIIQALNSEDSIKAIHDGAVELYHDGSKKLETASGGVTVTGAVTATTFESSTFSKTPTNTPAFHAYKSGSNSPALSESTWTKVTILTDETLDTDSAYDGSKFTVPSGKGGYYQVAAGINLFADNNDMKNALLAIYKNNNKTISNYGLVNNYAAGIRHYQTEVQGVLNLSAGDYLEVFAYITTNGGSAGYISNDATGLRGNYFSAFKLII